MRHPGRRATLLGERQSGKRRVVDRQLLPRKPGRHVGWAPKIDRRISRIWGAVICHQLPDKGLARKNPLVSFFFACVTNDAQMVLQPVNPDTDSIEAFKKATVWCFSVGAASASICIQDLTDCVEEGSKSWWQADSVVAS